MIRIPVPALLVLLVALGSTSAVFAQEDAFRAGIEARKDKKWQDAATQLRRAVQTDPKESTRKVRPRVLGIGLPGGGTEYLPRYFLGEALFNLSDCAGAVDEWAKSEQQGVIRAFPEFVKIIQNGYAACDEKGVLPPSKYDPALARTTQQITDVTALAGTVSKLGESNQELFRPEMREQYERAFNEIQAARSHRETATRTRAARDFNEVSAAAERARTVLMTLNVNLNAAIEGHRSFQRQASDIEQIINGAESTDRSIDGKKAFLTQALSAARQYGRDVMNQARDRLTTGIRTSNPALLDEARSYAQDAASRFKRLLDELATVERGLVDRQLNEAKLAAQEALSFVDGAFVTFDRLAAQKPTDLKPEMAAERQTLERQVTTVRRRVETAIKTANPAGIRAATKLVSEARDRVNALISLFGPLTIVDRGVHPALEQGARSFFAGEYEQTLSALNPTDGFAPEVPLQLHVHLFRAAALYALFVRSRELDRALWTRALEEVGRCRELVSDFQPDPRAFSPRFIAFFRETRSVSSPQPSPSAPSQQ